MDDSRTRSYRAPWRPAPIWLAAGVVLGPTCGALVGAGLGLVGSAGSRVDAMVFAASFGSFFGGVIGVVVGIIMTFAVGPHLPAQQARERAFLVAFCSTGLPAFAVLGTFFAFHPVALAAAFLSAVAGGALSYWLADFI